MVVHAFNPSIFKVEEGKSQFKANLVYTVSLRTFRATQGDFVKKQPKQTNKKKNPKPGKAAAS